MTLEALRVSNGYTQEQAADKLGISVQTLVSWEKGRTFPNVKQIRKIEDVYKTSYNDINFCV